MLPLTPILRQAAERVTARLDTGLVPYSEQEELIFAGSDFVAEQCIRHPDWLSALRSTRITSSSCAASAIISVSRAA